MRSRLIGVAVAGALAMTLVSVGTAGARGGNAVLNVVHGIPRVDVNVCVNGEAAIPDFKPGDVVTGVELPAGRTTSRSWPPPTRATTPRSWRRTASH